MSHMMEKMEYIPKIKFTLERGSYNTSDKLSDKQSANTWLHQRQKEQESRDQERNDRIIMKRLVSAPKIQIPQKICRFII